MSNVKTITRQVHVSDEFICLDGDENGEDKLAIEFDDALIKRIKELQEAVIALNAFSIEEFEYTPKWTELTIGGEPIRTDCSSMHVSATNVSWTCNLKGGPTEIYIAAIPLEDIFA